MHACLEIVRGGTARVDWRGLEWWAAYGVRLRAAVRGTGWAGLARSCAGSGLERQGEWTGQGGWV